MDPRILYKIVQVKATIYFCFIVRSLFGKKDGPPNLWQTSFKHRLQKIYHYCWRFLFISGTTWERLWFSFINLRMIIIDIKLVDIPYLLQQFVALAWIICCTVAIEYPHCFWNHNHRPILDLCIHMYVCMSISEKNKTIFGKQWWQ